MSCRFQSPVAIICLLLLVPILIPGAFVLVCGGFVRGANAEEVESKRVSASPPKVAAKSSQGQPKALRPGQVAPLNGRSVTPSAQPSGKLAYGAAASVPRGPTVSSRKPAVNAKTQRSTVPTPPKVAATPSTARPQARPVEERPVEERRPIVTQSEPPLMPQPEAELPNIEPVARRPFQPTLESSRNVDPPKQVVAEIPAPEPVEASAVKVVEANSADDRAAGEVELLVPPEPALVQRPTNHVPAKNAVPRELGPSPVKITDREESLFFEEPETDLKIADESLEFMPDGVLNETVREREPESKVVTTAARLQATTPTTTPKVEAAPEIVDEPQDRGPSQEVMAELRSVRTIDIRRAVEIPQLGQNENPDLNQPRDQALALLRHRTPRTIWPIYRDPWTACRDSYPFYHRPLWFEDPNLERCGRGFGPFTSTVSAAHFLGTIPILPYRMTAEPACCLVRTLPDCNVCERFGPRAYLPPWSWSAAAVQAAATVGLIYVVP